ncbi:MAG TPA: hypothetical protein PKK00_12945 [Bacteroidales bacterium]|nr:hypothetical protein [Bacteroidales bacterium]HPS18142.1 hypothetical protein [Bacteroidales bacterium]
MNIDKFDHIIKQLIAMLPQHTPKQDVWNNISSSLDEDMAMSRLKRMLKNNEHQPHPDIWAGIEASLNKPVFWKVLVKSAYIKYFLPAAVVTMLVLINPFSNNNNFKEVSNPVKRKVDFTQLIINSPIENGIKSINKSSDIKTPIQNGNIVPIVNSNNTLINKTENKAQPEIAENTITTQSPVELNNNEFIKQTLPYSAEPSSEYVNNQINLMNVLSFTEIESELLNGKKINTNPLQNFSEGLYTNKSKAVGSFSLEFIYSPEISLVNLKNSQSNDNNIDISIRKKAEIPSCSNTIGVEGKVDFHHWFFQTGLNYSKVTSLSKYHFRYIGIDTLDWALSDTSYIHVYNDSLGNSFDTLIIAYTWEPVTNIVKKEEKKNSLYHINYIQVPLIAGYHYGIRNMQFSISGGVSLGIPLSVNGRMMNAESYDISTVSEKTLPFNKIIYSGIIRLGASYFLSPHYSIFVQPSMQYMLNSVFDKTYPINQKYSTFSLRTGIAYRF